MKKMLPMLLIAGMIAACTHAAQKPVPTYQTFIIWYDEEIGKQPLLQKAKVEKAEIIYDYQNFNGMALRVPVRATVEKTQAEWAKVSGVLSVEPDQVMQLH